MVNATILGIEKDEAKGEIFNVGNGKATTVQKVAETLIQQYDKKVALNVTGQFRLGDIRHNYADLGSIRQKLGFKPSFTFERGIRNFTKWVQEQEVASDGYERSLEEMREKGLLK